MNKKIAQAMFSCIHKKPRPRREIFGDFFAKTGNTFPRLEALHQDRYCRRIVAWLIDKGYPIVSTSKGYCLATNKAHIEESQRQLLAKISAMSKRYRKTQATVAKVKGQKVLPFAHYWKQAKLQPNK